MASSVAFGRTVMEIVIVDREDSGEFMGTKCYLSADCDKDGALDLDDFGEHNGELCRAKPDCDDDTIADALDVDIDGDGLIEIGTTAELDGVRWVLSGSGRRLSEMAALNQTGCGDGVNRTACGGYELIRNISLAAYADGDGWMPLGHDTNSDMDSCQGTAFSGVFDGNGFTVRGMNINRSGEDCIGLFGHLSISAVIRNLMVEADSVIGRSRVGGLVGSGIHAEIISSSSVTRVVRGSSLVGGLMGIGDNAEIVSSFSVAGEARGDGNFVGGLVGSSENAEVVSSYSVAGGVRGSSFVGGLVGWGNGMEIASSYSVAGQVRVSGNTVGGLVGWGGRTEVVSSYSVAGVVRVNSSLGGLVGSGGDIDSSYWYTAVAIADNGKGEERTLAELRMPTDDNAYDASSTYATWMRGANIDDAAGVEDITIYCDEDLSGTIETDEMRDGSVAGERDNRIWDFGDSSDYPAIRCTPGELDDQRGWWFINSTGHPNVNQDRLDRLTLP